jgi:hypothetical protein
MLRFREEGYVLLVLLEHKIEEPHAGLILFREDLSQPGRAYVICLERQMKALKISD